MFPCNRRTARARPEKWRRESRPRFAIRKATRNWRCTNRACSGSAEPNIFEGYLKNAELSAEVLRDEWFRTGDLGRFDEDGFLYIEGRLSRFSKIGGEMVPHEMVEQKILTALNMNGQAERCIAVMGVPDAAKGEALVLLSAIEIDAQQLRAALRAADVPNLWVPRTICRVEAIPVLASGKLDLGKCKELANAA